MSSANTSRLEDDEQIDFVTWLEDRGLKFTAIPNSTYTKYVSVKVRNKRLGLRRGFPDMIVLVRRHESKDGEGYLLTIEMKRERGGKESEDQKDWREALNGLGLLNVQS